MLANWKMASESEPFTGTVHWSGLCWVSSGSTVTVGRYNKKEKTWWTLGKITVLKWDYADEPKP